jgi:hypothetical protein
MKTSLFLSLALLTAVPNDILAQNSFIYYKDLIVKTLTYAQQFWNSSRTAKIVTIGVGGLLFLVGRAYFVRKSRPTDRPAPQVDPATKVNVKLNWLENQFEQHPHQYHGNYLTRLNKVKSLLDQLQLDNKHYLLSKRYEFLKQIEPIKQTLFILSYFCLTHGNRIENPDKMLNEAERKLNDLNDNRVKFSAIQTTILDAQRVKFDTLHLQFPSIKQKGRS